MMQSHNKYPPTTINTKLPTLGEDDQGDILLHVLLMQGTEGIVDV
jgi:hypothetical protein